MTAGDGLGHYTIVRPLGRGGMGVVYLAHDTTLNRDVALKVLPVSGPAGLSEDSASRLERFRREAQAVAALNHPNIVTIYSVEDVGGVHFITLELVDGTTLAAHIPADGMSIETFFGIAIPLVDAVAAAHSRNVVHRDLKPANVMVTRDGRVKILDFGLAKLVDAPGGGEADTVTAGPPITEDGRVLGTAAYMSPEQAEAKPLDHRTDIFSLGVILYEMATGRQPFAGDSRLSMLAAIVRDAPAPVTDLNTRVPAHLGRIIRKTLEKTPARRYQLALELRNDLDELKREIDSGETALLGESGAQPGAPARTRSRLRPLLEAASIAGLAVAGWWVWSRGPGVPDTPVVSLTQVTTDGLSASPAISPDGQWIAYGRRGPGADAAFADIFLRAFGDRTAVQLTRDLGPVGFPSFSPDGASIAFCRTVGPGGIYVMGRMGGDVRRLTDRGFNPSWSPDGTELVYAHEMVYGNPYLRRSLRPGLVRVDVDTGDRHALEVGDAVQPSWSPNGHRIAFWGLNDEGWRDIYTTRADGDGDRTQLTSDVHVDFSPAWSPDGRWLYFASTRGGPMAIWRVAVDERTGEPRSDLEQVTEGGPTEPGLLSVSREGRIVFQQVLAQTRIEAADFDPVALRLSSNRRTIVEGTRRLVDLDVSPDGGWLVYRTEDAQQDIYVARTDGSGERQVTDDLAKDWRPRWSPDSTRLAFYSNASGSYQIWVINPDGSGRMRLTDATMAATLDPVWSPDGREIMYLETGVDSFVVRADTRFDQQTPRLVPRLQVDGRDVPFRAADWSPLTGRIAGSGVWVFSPATAAFESFVTGSPVTNPRWMSDGHRVYYLLNGRLMALDTGTRTETEIALPGVEGADTVRLSPDSRQAYLVVFSVQSDVWRLELR